MKCLIYPVPNCQRNFNSLVLRLTNYVIKPNHTFLILTHYLSRLVKRINNKGLNTTIDCIIYPKKLAESDDRDRYLSPTNYFFSLTGFAFFVQVLVRQIQLEQSNDLYFLPDRLLDYLEMKANFQEEYSFYLVYLGLMPLLTLLLFGVFPRYTLQKVFRLLMYWFGTIIFLGGLSSLLLPDYLMQWVFKPLVLLHAVYYALNTLYGPVWARLTKVTFALIFVMFFNGLFFRPFLDFVYYSLLHPDKVLFTTPDPVIIPSTAVIEDYSSEEHGYYWGDFAFGRLFYQPQGNRQRLSLFDSDMQNSDTITVEGRLIDIEALSRDTLAVVSAIKGSRDSSEFALLTFLNPANLKLISNHQLPKDYFTINDALWNGDLWVCGAELTAERISIPSLTRIGLLPDAIQTLEDIQFNDQQNARGSSIAVFEDELVLTTYKKEGIYLYDLSLHSVLPYKTFQLFEKRTQFNPTTTALMKVNPNNGTIVTVVKANDEVNVLPSITIFPFGRLEAGILVNFPVLADELLVSDLQFHKDQIHLAALINYVIPANYLWDQVRRYGLYLVINQKGEILEQQVFSSTAHYNYTPTEFLHITDSSASILGEEYQNIPLIGNQYNLISTTLRRKPEHSSK